MAMVTSYLELLESERFGPTRSKAQHLAALEKERNYTFVIPSSEPSTESVELLRRRWQSLRYVKARKKAVWQLLRGSQNGKD